MSGAGNTPKREYLFAEVADDYRAYGVGNTHRHLKEMTATLGTLGADADLVFTPHLLPVARGILSTITIPLTATLADPLAIYRDAYAGEPFIEVADQQPTLHDVVQRNGDLAAENPDKLAELEKLWFSEAAKYNGLPLADLNMLETLMRYRPYLTGTRESYTYYPGTADVGMGAAVEIQGRSFAIIADVSVDTTGAEGVIIKHGGAHGGHVLFVQDGRLHYVYNFLGEEEQRLSSSDAVLLGKHTFGVAFVRTGTVEGSHTPLGDTALYIDDAEVASLSGMKIHPGTFGLAGASLSIGKNTGSPVSRAYKAPFPFAGGNIAQVNVDVSGKPYVDLEREFARAFAKD